ncbi:MAG TPA: SUMF1/EgtB/PvdO family nonheme iron enzyme [Anaerolineales bacterium]|nr:SUMF1/EgtB/PvdO family nonheme iron enzyme [Anaerolineales bacterium]
MNSASKRVQLTVILIVLLMVALLTGYAAFKGVLRPLYFAAATELRLARRGDPLVRIRFAGRDGMNQVYIPAGEFTMGTDSAAIRKGDVLHKVTLHAYWIDQFTVTNAMYRLCVQARKCRHTASYDTYLDDPAYKDYPVHYVNWFDAQAYCKWEGGRLPTEAEWEKAARGVNALRYPWGNSLPDASLLNYNDEFGKPVSAYSYWAGMSPYGLLNMAGNVQQWVADWYGSDYYARSPEQNPTGPADGTLKVLRGGGFWDSAKEVTTYFRFKHDPSSSGAHRGIRCAADN